MNSGRSRFDRRLIRAFYPLLLALPALLAGCILPCSPPPGSIYIKIDTVSTERCDDGIKVEVAINDSSGALVSDNDDHGENECSYGGGVNWEWQKPGCILDALIWTDTGYDNLVPSGTVTVKAYCMRKNAPPGYSERSFVIDDYITDGPFHRFAGLAIGIMDTGTDPEYTVQSPAPEIMDYDRWCEFDDHCYHAD